MLMMAGIASGHILQYNPITIGLFTAIDLRAITLRRKQLISMHIFIKCEYVQTNGVVERSSYVMQVNEPCFEQL